MSNKELSQIQIDAARMLAKGDMTDSQIAVSLERSRRWVNSQKKLPEIQELIEEFRETYKQASLEDNEDRMRAAMRISSKRMCETYNTLFKICDTFAERLMTRVKDLDCDDLKANTLAQSIKQITDSYQNAINIETQYYGLERIIKDLEKVRKLNGLD